VQSRKQILFAGIVEELLKGFHLLHEACEILWRRRQDFELVATSEPVGQADHFTRFVGWLSQDELPRWLHVCDMLVMPTIAQEALGRTAVEAMAAGRPVIASRLGGLPFTVVDGQTGLLFEPGNPADLAGKIASLLDDPELAERLGLEGRLRFVREYSWDVIVQRHYKPILMPRRHEARDENPSPRASSPRGEGAEVRVSLIVSVLDSHEVVRRQLLCHTNCNSEHALRAGHSHSSA
jgi:glycosyltransferase involved in cell wall biosynthesis